jgi:hypothetical protein
MVDMHIIVRWWGRWRLGWRPHACGGARVLDRHSTGMALCVCAGQSNQQFVENLHVGNYFIVAKQINCGQLNGVLRLCLCCRALGVIV